MSFGFFAHPVVESYFCHYGALFANLTYHYTPAPSARKYLKLIPGDNYVYMVYIYPVDNLLACICIHAIFTSEANK